MSIRRKPLTRAELDAAVKAHTDWAWNTSKRGQRSAERAEAESAESGSDELRALRAEVEDMKEILALILEKLAGTEVRS